MAQNPNIQTKADAVKDAIVALWSATISSITNPSGNTYRINATSHGIIKNSDFADYVTIFDDTDGFFKQYNVTNSTANYFDVVDSENDLTALSSPEYRLLSGHTQNVCPDEYDNDGNGVYPISRYPVIVILPIEYIYNTELDNFNACDEYRLQAVLIDKNENHNLSGHAQADLQTSVSQGENRHFVANRMNIIINALRGRIKSRDILAHIGNYGRDTEGEILDFVISEGELLRC